MLGFYREDFEDFEKECDKTVEELNTKTSLTNEEVLKYLKLMAERQAVFASFMESRN